MADCNHSSWMEFDMYCLYVLLQLWSSLKPDFPLKSRIGQHWGEIGFQGDDPATDFRGMGLLGLKNLV